MEYIFIIAIGLLGFFAISLLSRPSKTLSDWIFMVWILLLLVTEFSFAFYAQGNLSKHPKFITAICDSHLLHPFLLYLYTLSFTNKDYQLRPKVMLHLLPFVLFIGAKLYTNFGIGVMECYEDGSCMNASNTYVTLFYIYKYLIMILYIHLSFKLVKHHKDMINSEEEALRHIWISNLIKGTLFLFIGILLIQVFRVAFPIQLYDRMLITSTLATLFVFILLYMANSHASLFVQQRRKPASNKTKKEVEVDVECTKEEVEIFNRLENYIKTTQIYLNGMLTLKDVAEDISCPQRMLSQSINNVTGNSFTYYINSLRIAHLKRLLNSPDKQHYTILSLAEESGFNSKSTLVRIFKQHTGMTPSEYQNKKQT